MRNSKDYIMALHEKTSEIIEKTINTDDLFTRCNNFSEKLIHLKNFIPDQMECDHIDFVSNQIQISGFLLSMGLYRQAFSALRLGLELGVACIYFSLNKLEHLEWLNGKKDIVWSKLTDAELGVLSERFITAFSCKNENITILNSTAKNVYRRLSEHVHGNKQTFDSSLLHLDFHPEMIIIFRKSVEDIINVLLSLFFIRYHSFISEGQKDDLAFTFEDILHKDYIRSFFGGPKGL